MCGIWCCFSSCGLPHGTGTVAETSKEYQDLLEFVSRRGPDFSVSRCFPLQSGGYVHLFSHVLWTQGTVLEHQPFENPEGNKFMLYNGDIYSFDGLNYDEEDVWEPNSPTSTIRNDGALLFSALNECRNETEICSVIKELQGPFAFILFDNLQGIIYFARDYFGRESLLFSYDTTEQPTTWNISSVSVLENVLEVPTSGLFSYNLKTKQLNVFRYNHSRESIDVVQNDFLSTLTNVGLVDTVSICPITIPLHFSVTLKFPEHNDEALIDKDIVLANLVKDATNLNCAEDFIRRSVDHLSSSVNSFIEHLRRAVKRRVMTIPPFCKNCLKLQLLCDHSKVGVLFSGGLDSTVVAYLAAEALPDNSSLDLINVAFSKDNNFDDVPDRETALASYKMLKQRFKGQGKRINLVLVNIGRAEVEELRAKRIKYLISPLKSVLDDSVGVCLWFAARGVGYIYDNPDNDSPTKNSHAKYASPIRVVLLGSGADELLGGYSRHRSAYEKSGWNGLRSEMQLDFDRISLRNMGRDNRIVSDHGICPRIPFLDENVVHFLMEECNLWVKCCPVSAGPLGSRGTGEKLLLRAVGAKLFGDEYLSLALFPKRAMQFGSKIAKLENRKEKGGDSCQRLLRS